ncbi:hypothetical protein TNCT_242261 [Trichonephila clavata]|uniref:Uncharacterized protein n=1 Tax=Trichonephila clavata TaxID=2740835 RepID=A0A8X6F0F2_TRICU|nr:hypothetical protein TNCT_242261 [Trichonephila clavata]
MDLNYHNDNPRLFDATGEDILKVRDSLLVPWQKLYAIRSIILHRLDFACRNAHVRKSQTESLDKTIVSVAKHILHFPSRANAIIVQLACHKGSAELPLLGLAPHPHNRTRVLLPLVLRRNSFRCCSRRPYECGP